MDVKRLREFGFPEGSVGDTDLERWMTESFSFASHLDHRRADGLQGPSSNSLPVLKQTNGGPCGVLAAVQGHILMEMLFQRAQDNLGEEDGLALALVDILWRARSGEQAVVCTGDVKNDQINRKAFSDRTAMVDFMSSHVAQFMSDGGIMMFMYSLMETRTIEQIRSDMDDPTQGLTGQFGHCTQELMNLLLCGVAASQVHDGTVDLGDGLRLRGVPVRPSIGYLTHLEALRYCQVGTFYKKPTFPIWVIGSESHYTVLFTRTKSINEESLRQKQFNNAKRAFNEMDSQENGFVAVEKIAQVVRNLGLEMSEMDMAQFISHCEMPGSGIILWNNFWVNIKPYLVPKLDWSCPACTYINDKSKDTCEMCLSKRTDDTNFDDGNEEDVDDGPHTFEFTHINGLVSVRQGQQQGPTVTDFSLTIISKDLQAPSTHGHGVPIEEVLHTRWSGSVFLWPNDQPPNING